MADLVLECSGTLEFTLVGKHVQQHVKFTHLGDIALDVQGGFLGIQSGCKVFSQDVLHIRMEVIRMRMGRKGMEVCYEVVTLILVLYAHEVAKRSVIISKMQLARGPDSAKYYFHMCQFFTSVPELWLH